MHTFIIHIYSFVKKKCFTFNLFYHLNENMRFNAWYSQKLSYVMIHRSTSFHLIKLPSD